MIKTRIEPDVQNYFMKNFCAPGFEWYLKIPIMEKKAYERHLAVIENSDKKKEAWNLLANLSCAKPVLNGGLRREMKCFKCVITWQRFIFEKTGLFCVYILNHGSGSFIFDGKNFWWWWWSSIIKETLSLQLLLCARKFTFCEFYWKRTFILLPKWRKLAKGGGGVGTLLLLTASAWGYKVVYYSSSSETLFLVSSVRK